MKTPKKVRAALLPPAEQALGLCLGPCSARHYIALETLASPVIGCATPPRRPTLADYAAAALLLSLDPRAAAALAADPAALKTQVDALLDLHTLADLQAGANAVTRRVAAALGIDLQSKEKPAPGGTTAEPPPDPR